MGPKYFLKELSRYRIGTYADVIYRNALLYGDRLAGYKAPKSVEFVETLPKNPAGKILKRQLREKYWEERDRKI